MKCLLHIHICKVIDNENANTIVYDYLVIPL